MCLLQNQQIAIKLLKNIQVEHNQGYDPFDALNSRLFHFLQLDRSRFLRLAWLQFHKRSPINFRGLVGVPKVRNPKACALVLMGCLHLYRSIQDDSYLKEAVAQAQWLVNHQCAGWGGAAWGYPFDWQARAFYVPKGKPNLIATAYVARSLRMLGEYCNDSRWIDYANSAGEFVMQHLLCDHNSRPFFAYIPGETALVHNANLWAAVIVVASALSMNKPEWISVTKGAINTTLQAQSSDGSWVYGDRAHHQFIDGFHSGYNLEALQELQSLLKNNDYQRNIDQGFQFYINHCMNDRGVVYYYADQPYPQDAHSYAQALVTLTKLDSKKQYNSLKQSVFDRLVSKFYNAKKQYFYYQIHRWYKNKINYLRWVQAWIFYALSMMDD